MTLEERIMQDLKEAMKAKDQAALRGIRAIKAAILLAKTDGSGDEITPEKEIKMLQKLVKQRRESLGIFEQQGRADLALIESEEIEVLERYLPKQLDGEALEAIVRNIIAETGATGVKDMGKVMGAATKQLAGQADGKVVGEVVKRLLGL
ncbi:MAG: GatB/YqeY domain-containing protein [Saprospiraceae bacterium]